MDNGKSNKLDSDIDRSQISIIDLFEVVLSWRRFILLNFMCVSFLALIVSFVLPNWYRSTASILPPKDQGQMNLLGLSASVLKSLPLNQKFTSLGQRPGVYNYLAILKSRSAMESVVKKFDLIKVYEVEDSSMERAIKILEDNVSFDIQEEENITIEVVDKNASLAADMANYFVEVLNSLSIQLGTMEARSNREFVEKRLNESKQALHRAEDVLKSYQEKSGLVLLPDQNSASVSSIAELYGLKAKKEVELAILKKKVSGENVVVQQIQDELAEIERKLSTFPLQGLESLRLYREALIHQKIVEFLIPMYEQAKIDEQKDIPVLLILDRAVPAEKKFKPKRLTVILTASCLSFLSSFLVILFSIYLKNVKRVQPTQYERIRLLFFEIRNPIKALGSITKKHK